MKTLYATTITFFLGISCLHAQRIHFTDTSNRWVTKYTVFNDAGEGFTYYPRYRLKDTVFNGEFGYIHYDEMYLAERPLFLIEDTTERKVYARKMYDSDTARFVLYDFNLAVGDSILIPLIYDTTAIAHICYEVYPDVLINGVPHHAFLMSGGMGYRVIEGIGSMFGPLQPFIGTGEWMPELICFENNGGEPEFSSLFTSYCYLSTADQMKQKVELRLLPNPASCMLHISLPQSTESFQFAVYDLLGRQMYHGTLRYQASLDVSAWQNGMYIVQIKDDKGNTSVERFVKQ